MIASYGEVSEWDVSLVSDFSYVLGKETSVSSANGREFFNENIDFCGVSNMERYNLSNGFIYAKKQSKIIEKNIELTYKKYRKALSNNLLGNVKFIGGCYIMGEVISELVSSKQMPLGSLEINGEKCKFLH